MPCKYRSLRLTCLLRRNYSVPFSHIVVNYIELAFCDFLWYTGSVSSRYLCKEEKITHTFSGIR